MLPPINLNLNTKVNRRRKLSSSRYYKLFFLLAFASPARKKTVSGAFPPDLCAVSYLPQIGIGVRDRASCLSGFGIPDLCRVVHAGLIGLGGLMQVRTASSIQYRFEHLGHLFPQPYNRVINPTTERGWTR